MSELQRLADARGPHPLQQVADGALSGDTRADRMGRNGTGLPDGLIAGVEVLSGTDLSDVTVRFASSEPGKIGAHAFARGAEIHVAPGQERHLPHEAWHVAQQKLGRVRATGSVAGVPVNDDPRLEAEADRMGARAQGLGDR